MDQGAGNVRERVVQQERADARERVRTAQEREAGVREASQHDARERAARRRLTAAGQEASQPVAPDNVTDGPSLPDADDAGRGEEMT